MNARTATSSEAAASPEAPWQAGLRGARANFWPGLLLQGSALLLVLAYYQHAPTRALVAQLSDFRAATGVWYAIVATALFGGVLPFIYLKLRLATRTRYTWAQGTFLAVFWAYKGWEVDLWYQVLATVVGEDHSARTVLTKMVLDQFVYCPLWAVPATWVAYTWNEWHFAWAPVGRELARPGWYRRAVVPLLLANFGVWVPAVCIIYALPTALQLPLFNLVLCFHTLLMAQLAQRPAGELIPKQ